MATSLAYRLQEFESCDVRVFAGANVQQQKNALSELRVKKARLQKIAAWETGLVRIGLGAAGLGAAGAAYHRIVGAP